MLGNSHVLEFAVWSRQMALALLLALGVSVGAGLAVPVPIVAGFFFFIFLGKFRGYRGAANVVTLFRLAIVFLLWFVEERRVVAGLGLCVLCADGLDGWLARRLGSASEFGARFDMETDAFLMLALSWSLYRGPVPELWALIPGCLRYVFVLYRGLGENRVARFAWGRAVYAIVVLALLLSLLSPETQAYFLVAGASALLAASFGYELFLAGRG